MAGESAIQQEDVIMILKGTQTVTANGSLMITIDGAGGFLRFFRPFREDDKDSHTLTIRGEAQGDDCEQTRPATE